MLNLPPSRNLGFTLIEMLITVTILGLAVAAGLPSITTWMRNSQIRTAAEGIQNGMHLARIEAVRRNATVEFKLDSTIGAGATGWTVTALNNNEVIQASPSGEGTRTVTIARIPVTATKLTFDGFGRLPSGASPKNPDGSDVLTRVDIDSDSLAAADSHNLRVVVVGGSEIRMCDPSVSDVKDPRTCPPTP